MKLSCFANSTNIFRHSTNIFRHSHRLSFLAKNKSANAKRGFRARRQQTDADLAVRLTTMENNA